MLFATNAGMFNSALKPVGLYVERGQELVHVSTRSGYGNFHMKPNGVFYISGDRAGVAETRAFLKQRPQVDLATQSGPMLVINGRLHPRFDRSSTSLKARNGVGVRADGKVIFAISQAEVSFDHGLLQCLELTSCARGLIYFREILLQRPISGGAMRCWWRSIVCLAVSSFI